MNAPYDPADAVEAHADKVLRAAGSGLKHYTMPTVRRAILSAMLDAIEEAYRAGADFAGEHCRAANFASDAAQAEAAAIVAWMRKHGMRQTADAIQRGDYKHD